MNVIEAAKAAGFEQVMRHKDGSSTVLPTALFERFAQIIRNQALEEAQADLADALISDCEHGVKWLNDKAAKDFKAIYPRLEAAIRAMKKEQPNG